MDCEKGRVAHPLSGFQLPGGRSLVGRVARALIWNWRVPHLSRRVTGGAGGPAFSAGLNFRVAAPSRSFEGAEGLGISSFIGNCMTASPTRRATIRRSPMMRLAV